MSSSIWTRDAVSSNCRRRSETVWRMVEAQHLATTMKLVDTAEEQDILEAILEESKPPLPPDVVGLGYLLASPFRYAPLAPGSRFRSPTDPGVFYGAGTIRTSAAEIGFWRWKFLQETEGLKRLGPAAHTAFSAPIDTTTVDLRLAPFDKDAAVWSDPSDYSRTQAFARVARQAETGAILYGSVRDPEPGWCAAVLDPRAFSNKEHDPVTQTWQLVVTQTEAIWRRNGDKFSFSTGQWF